MNMNLFFAFMIIPMALFGCSSVQAKQSNTYDLACNNEQQSGEGKSPWHISNLYDCKKSELFIPYQLWTGEKWHGDKYGSCMHDADTQFYVNAKSGTTIKGPKKWVNPKTNNIIEVWSREKMSGSKQQYFACNDKGIGRVFDSRKGGKYYRQGRCKFPAGFGWEVGKKRKCLNTAIEITKLEFDSEKNLSGIEFKWWYKNRSGNYIHDHTYRYEPNVGSVKAWKQ